MKKILTHLTGIVFLITILIAGACSPVNDMKKVKIYCNAFEKEGVMQLKMYDSNDPDIVVIDTLETLVKPGTKVIWMWLPDSEIQEFVKISPKKTGPIMTGNARKVLGTKKLQLKIPKKAPVPSAREKYDIVFKDKDGNIHPIDPYLRIPTLGGI